MFILTAKIQIKSEKTWTFEKIVSVEIEKNAEMLTTTCKITLPKKIKWLGEDNMPLERGNEVKVWLGYDQPDQLAFCGYITKIGAKTPIVIECEDDMWKLKSIPANKKAYASATIKQILNDQNLPYETSVFGEQSLGSYRVDCNNVAELLGAWREQGVRSFFKYDGIGESTLHCGVIFDRNTNRVQVFDDSKNMINSDGLNWQCAKDIKIKVKAVSLDSKNKKITVEEGDKDGEIRTLHATNKTEKELREWAKQELVRLKRDGLTGTFETFGAFLVDRGDVIGVIMDGKKRGIYQVKKNTIRYGAGGFRQSVEIGDRMDGAE